MRRVPIPRAALDAISAGRFVRVELGAIFVAAPDLRTRSALVGRAGGRLVAYANVCRHQPLPLDVASDPETSPEGARLAPMDDDKVHLFCHSHGALYRTADGECVGGPCLGEHLVPIAIDEGENALLLP